ncbi:hypothetical protein BgAZ_404690 [Babesia gibsoni]|uniref:Macro domain-containing protein n=1 Tax=Babesia gibsoni TaxID=33632 RepID=A0AAD8LHR7_BABGI|nr:hypothetical protein BgAZ_404690 [Babesia gibsoni]
MRDCSSLLVSVFRCRRTDIVRHFGSSSFLQSRLRTVRERALSQNIDWIRSVETIKSAKPPYLQSQETNFLDKCRNPFTMRKDHVESDTNDNTLSDFHGGFIGCIEELKIDGFGSITVEHGDILKRKADCILVPVPPNLTPYAGLGLKVLECGGKKLITALVKRAKVLISERLDALEKIKSEFKDQNEYEATLKDAKVLNIGDVILTPPYDVAEATVIGFLVTPHFWETSTRDATLKLRHTLKTALENLNRLRIGSVLCPYLVDSLNGFEPRYAMHAMIEEAHDVLMQLDAIKPSYNLRHIYFVHRNQKEARKLGNALIDVAHEKRPDMQVQPAPVYFNRASQRIIEFDESVLKFCSQYSKLTYKRHSAVTKSRRKYWLRNLKPFVWRPSRMYQPPPLFVYKSTGLTALRQQQPRPFYKDKLSHVLFPPARPSVKGMKVGMDGRWKAKTKTDPIYVQTKAL